LSGKRKLSNEKFTAAITSNVRIRKLESSYNKIRFLKREKEIGAEVD